MNLTKRQTTIVLAVASVSLVAALALLLYYFFVTNVKEEDIDMYNILREALYEFPVVEVKDYITQNAINNNSIVCKYVDKLVSIVSTKSACATG